MFILKLPQEVIDHIVDDIESDYVEPDYVSSDLDYDTPEAAEARAERDGALRLCGSINRIFRHRARTLLFSDITLRIFPDDPPPSTQYSQALRLVLEEALDLAACARKLTLELATLPDTEYCAITFSNEDLPRIFDMLIRLRSLNLRSENKDCDWSKFEPNLRSAFFKLQNSQLVEVLRISGRNLRIPLDILVHWTSLKELVIHKQAILTQVNELVPWEILWHEVPQLESLSIIVVGKKAMLTILLPFLGSYQWKVLKSLKSLTVSFTDTKEFSLVEGLILRTAKHLETVTFLNLFSMTPLDNFWYCPTGYPSLRTIVIEENSFGRDDTPMSVNDFIATFVSYCPNLEALRLVPSWYFSDVDKSLQMDWELKSFNVPIWARLDAALSNLKSFKNLFVGLRLEYTEEEWNERVNQPLINELRSRLTYPVLFPKLWESVKRDGQKGKICFGVWLSGQELDDAPEGLDGIYFTRSY